MRNPACPRSVRLLPLLLLPLATLLVAGPARAQVSVGDRRCIEEINNGTRKTLLAENKAVNGCMRSFVKGTLATPTVAQCAAPAASIKVQKEVDRSLANANKRCVGAPPSFGPPSISNHPTAAVQAGTGTLADLFGPAVEGTLLTDKDGNRCQDQVHKAVLRCEDTRLKEFLTCKRNAMKTGIATDAATLESACFGTGPDQPDPKGKIALACSSKVQKQVDTRCVAEGINLAVAFPACAALSGPSLTACLDSRVRCRTCDLLNTVDGLAKDCDLYDDGNDSNSSCSEPTTCGDGTVDGTEICDDGNVAAGDGCNASCQTELGWTCTGAPSACAPVCGDGLLTGGEACDDSNTAPGDGCSATCTVESGYSCSGAPSVCLANCGDGLVNGPETCDDGGLSSGDGCSASCQTESGWICSGAPSSCNTVCGDGIVAGAEACDDDGTAAGDGCSATCTIETGYTCSGSPSSCSATCGDGLIIGDEECDDGGLVPGDGCDASCDIEAGFACSGAPSLCSRFDVIITSPANGSFTTAATATIEGVVTQLAPALASLTVNGVAVPVAGDGTFSTEVTLAPSAIFNPVRATVTDTVHGGVAHDRVVVIWGDSVTDGGLSPETVALRLNDTGLDQVEPLVADLAGAGLNLADLVPVDTVLINN